MAVLLKRQLRDIVVELQRNFYTPILSENDLPRFDGDYIILTAEGNFATAWFDGEKNFCKSKEDLTWVTYSAIAWRTKTSADK